MAQTEDGYILGVFRIPHGRSGGGEADRPVAFLQHGLLDSSYTWVNNYADQSLAYLLADAGWDVWMGNSRGNTWSKAHVSLPVDSKKFWDFRCAPRPARATSPPCARPLAGGMCSRARPTQLG